MSDSPTNPGLPREAREVKKTPSLWRRALKWALRVAFAIFALLTLAAIGGAVYQMVATTRDAREFPPPGEFVDIGGRSLHWVCRGEGSPTVILEAGAQDWSTGWERPQAELASLTRVCAYDRAGVGWSDSSDDPKDGSHMVSDLDRLMRAASVERPVVLVGHSLGGMLIQIFASRYPEDVAGLVLVEPGDPDEVADMFPESDGVPAMGIWVDAVAGGAARLGVLRWMLRDLFEDDDYPAHEIGATRARVSLPAAARALASSIRHLPVTAEETRQARWGEIPARVIVSSLFDEVGTSFEDEAERQQFRQAMLASWSELASRGRGKPPVVFVEGANHVTVVRDQRYFPMVVRAVEEVVEEVRAAGSAN